MSKFKVTYHNGDVAEIGSETTNVVDFCNEHFGSVWAYAQEHGATVELLEDAVQAPDVPPNVVGDTATGGGEVLVLGTDETV